MRYLINNKASQISPRFTGSVIAVKKEDSHLWSVSLFVCVRLPLSFINITQAFLPPLFFYMGKHQTNMQVLCYIHFICIFLHNKQIRTHQTQNADIQNLRADRLTSGVGVLSVTTTKAGVCVRLCAALFWWRDGPSLAARQEKQRGVSQGWTLDLCTWNGRPEEKWQKAGLMTHAR